MEDEKHKAALWNRVADLKLKDLMTLGAMIRTRIEEKLAEPSPMEVKGYYLRPTAEAGVFEQRYEHWRRRDRLDPKFLEGEFDLQGKRGPAELVSSGATGRRYRFIENLSSEFAEDNPKDPRVVGKLLMMKAEDFTYDVYEQISGDRFTGEWGPEQTKTRWD